MKKFFLPILAACGMLAGFTLSSCGGGGGGDVDISGVEIVASATPRFTMQLGARMGQSNLYEATYIFGVSDYSGTFSVTEGYPLLNEDGQMELRGLMAPDETSAQQDKDLITWLGGPPQAVSVQIESDGIEITIKADKDSNSGTMTRSLQGVYFKDANLSVQLPEDKAFGSIYVTGTKRLFRSLKPASDEE